MSANATLAPAAFLVDCVSVSKIRRKDSVGPLDTFLTTADAGFFSHALMLRVLFHFNKYITFNIPHGVAHITFQIHFVISDAILAKALLPIAYLYPLPLDIGLRVYCILFFCHFWVKIALPVFVLTFSTPADLYLRFPYLHFPPLPIVLRFSVLAYSIPRYLRFPYLHFQSPHQCICVVELLDPERVPHGCKRCCCCCCCCSCMDLYSCCCYQFSIPKTFLYFATDRY